MQIKEYINQKFNGFGVRLSNADLLGICLKNSFEEDVDVTKSNVESVEIAIVKHIPILLVSPSSISEGGMSISKAQRDDIMQYYNYGCQQYHIKNTLITKPKITLM